MASIPAISGVNMGNAIGTFLGDTNTISIKGTYNKNTKPFDLGSATSDSAVFNELKSGLERASEQAKGYLEEAKSLYQPYVQSGTQSLNEYMKLLMGGVDSLSEDQNFQALQDLAEKKVMANRAVSGLLRSGATASALDDTLLNFANTYYTNRLNQLGQGVSLGQYGTDATSSIYDKLGTNATDLAQAIANIKMQQEANKTTIEAARLSAKAAKDAADDSFSVFDPTTWF